MISLQSTLTELDRWEKLQAATMDCYKSAIASIRQYVVELDQAAAEEHRKHLERILADVSAGELDTLLESRSNLRGELREYQDKSAKCIKRLREELVSTSAALRDLVGAITATSDEVEDGLQNELRKLKTLSRCQDIAAMRQGLEGVANSIGTYIEDLRKSNQMVITQLRDEIRTLQSRIEKIQRRPTQASDPDEGLSADRRQVETLVRQYCAQSTCFCTILLWLSNWPSVLREGGEKQAGQVVEAFVRRLAGEIGTNGAIRRCAEDEFAAVLPVAKAEGMELVKDLSAKLNGSYVSMEDGYAHSYPLEVRIAVVENRSDQSMPELMARISSCMKALRATP